MRNRSWLLAIFLGFALLYSAVQNVGYFDASDSYHRFKVMEALVTTGSPNWKVPGQAEPYICLNSFGPVLPALPFQALGYLGHASGILDGQLQQIVIRSTLVSTVFYTSLWMCAIAQLSVLLGYGRKKSLAVCCIVGVGTLVFPYSKSAQAENLVGLCITTIILLLVMHSQKQRMRYIIGVGLLYGFLLTVKNELAAVFPLLFIAVLSTGSGFSTRKMFLNWKTGITFLAAIAPGIAVVLWFNYSRFGNILTTGHLGDSHGRSLLTPFQHPFWLGLYLQLFSPGKGMFWYCPVLFASVPLLWIFLRKQKRLLLLPYCWWVLMTCVYAKWYSPTGDTALGSRFQVSYLGFLVMPLLALPSLQGTLRLPYKLWAIFCTLISVCLQILFCFVSFNIDFHKKLYAAPQTEWIAQFEKMYYTLNYSLLGGFFKTAREGFLDMYYVRLRPLESALTILPGFWWLLAGSASAFGIAVYFSRKVDEANFGFAWKHLFTRQLPALCLALLGLFQVGHPKDSGLRLQLADGKGASYETIVQDIAIENLHDGREVYSVESPFAIDWSGQLHCSWTGTYSFSTDSNRSVKIILAGQEKTIPAGQSVTEFTVTKKGWQPFAIHCPETYNTDRFSIKVQFPGKTSYKPLGSVKLRH